MNGSSASSYDRGREMADRLQPGLEDALAGRYDHLVPGMSRTVVDVAWGQFYARGALDERTRFLATIAGLAAMGGQTAPQLKVHVASALRAGATPQEIAEVIFQMALYGGFPAMINAMNAAMEVFDQDEAAA